MWDLGGRRVTPKTHGFKGEANRKKVRKEGGHLITTIKYIDGTYFNAIKLYQNA